MPDTTTYSIVKKSVAMPVFLSGFTVTDDAGATVFDVVSEKHLTSHQWDVKDAHGTVVATLRQHAALRPQFRIERPGQPEVILQEISVMPTRHNWRLQGVPGGDIEINGTISDHSFEFTDASGAVVAQTSRAWMTLHAAYGVRVSGLDPLLAVVAALGMDITESMREH